MTSRTRPGKASSACGLRGGSSGQAIVEAAFAFSLMILLVTGVVSVGQSIGYGDGLANAAATAASAAAAQARAGSSGNAITAAVAAVNREQNVSMWTVCNSSNTPPCVAVSSKSQSTGGITSITVESATLYGSYSPIFNLFGLSIPITVAAAARV